MKPAWDALVEEYANHPTKRVAKFDCTQEGGDPICDEQDVKGFPTLKFGEAHNLEKYTGGRDDEALRKWVEEGEPSCSVKYIDRCDDDQKARLAEFQKLSPRDLDNQIFRKQRAMQMVEYDFKKYVEVIQKIHENMMQEKTEKEGNVTAGGLASLRQAMLAKDAEKFFALYKNDEDYHPKK